MGEGGGEEAGALPRASSRTWWEIDTFSFPQKFLKEKKKTKIKTPHAGLMLAIIPTGIGYIIEYI